MSVQGGKTVYLQGGKTAYMYKLKYVQGSGRMYIADVYRIYNILCTAADKKLLAVHCNKAENKNQT